MSTTLSHETRVPAATTPSGHSRRWRGILGWVLMVSITEASLVAAALALTVVVALQAAGDPEPAPASSTTSVLAMPAFEPLDDAKPPMATERPSVD